MTLVRMTQRARPPVVVVALTVLALAGCGGSSGGTAGQTQVSTTATAAETTGKTLDFCAREDATTKIVHFRGAGTDLDGVVIGSGANGVVLAHQLHSNVCSWLPFAQRLAGGGVRVLVFDFPGTTDLDRYVLAPVAELRHQGAHSIALAGASMGGTAVLVAANRDSKISRVAISPGRAVSRVLPPGPRCRDCVCPRSLSLGKRTRRTSRTHARCIAQLRPTRGSWSSLAPTTEPTSSTTSRSPISCLRSWKATELAWLL